MARFCTIAIVKQEQPQATSLQERSENVTIDDMSRQRIYINDKNRLLERATPQRGTVSYQTTPNSNEQRTIDWLYNNIGGNITVLAENNPDGLPNPDLLWNNVLVDIKHTGGTWRTLDGHVHKSMKQTNNGGVIIDVTGTLLEDVSIIDTVRRRLNGRNGAFAIVLKNEELLAYLTEE